MLASWITFYDILFWTMVVIIVVLAVASYKYGYAVGYSEGRHQLRSSKRDEDTAPEWATSVKIINRRRGKY